MTKAIETGYRGHRFRSRLEARWAVFFDALGLHYDYEPEGYQLTSGWYLPDFWLPAWRCWFEVKPFPDSQHLQSSDHDFKLCLDILNEVRGELAILTQGTPWPGEHCSWVISNDPADQPFWAMCHNHFTACRRCEGLCLLAEESGRAGAFVDALGFMDLGEHTCGDHDKRPLPAGPMEFGGVYAEKVFAAYRAARSARFEHREAI
jgi:hypothetical protein